MDSLQAALGHGVDFVFVSFPGLLAICADHDEYTTFYTLDDATLNRLALELVIQQVSSLFRATDAAIVDRKSPCSSQSGLLDSECAALSSKGIHVDTTGVLPVRSS